MQMDFKQEIAMQHAAAPSLEGWLVLTVGIGQLHAQTCILWCCISQLDIDIHTKAQTNTISFVL